MYADILAISLEQSPAWEAGEEIIGVVCTPNVNCHVHKSLSRIHVVWQTKSSPHPNLFIENTL